MNQIQATKYVIYDLETVPDLKLFAEIKYPGLKPDEALAAYAEKTGKDDPFIPATFHRPVSLAIMKVDKDYRALSSPVTLEKDPVETFWQGLTVFKPILVDFNGSGFDIPVLVMEAFRLGIPVPEYFAPANQAQNYRYRYGKRHLDLQDWITSYGAFPMTGGLSLLSKLSGGPGKGEIDGSMVRELWEKEEEEKVHEYCRRDVIETYRVFLRTRRLMGLISESEEEALLKDVL